MKVFGLMLREDSSDRALREALARDSMQMAARGEPALASRVFGLERRSLAS